MRKLVLKMSMSIDGFVGGLRGEIDWIFSSVDGGVMDWLADTVSRAGVHIMGSKTYQDMIAYWPHSTDTLAAPMNQLPKVVFSKKGVVRADRSLTTTALRDATRLKAADQASDAATLASWTSARVAKGDLVAEIRGLKEDPGSYILAHGGAGFARSLAASGLIDEYRLLIHPVALGAGLSLFGTLPEPQHLRLLGTTAFESGAVASVYGRIAAC